MPTLEQVDGTYAHSQIIQPLGFQLNGVSAPTVLRDGTNVSTASGKMFTVSRTSAGLYHVVLDQKTPWPELPFIFPHVEQAAAPAAPVKIHYVKGSYSKTTRSFDVQIQTVGTAPAASDGDANDRVTILLMGSLMSTGTDPA